jgi:hypothetical protein
MVGRISMKAFRNATSSLESQLSRGDRWRDPARPQKKHPFEGAGGRLVQATVSSRMVPPDSLNAKMSHVQR